MTTLILFCNLGYGKAFLEAFSNRANLNSEIQYTVVVSTPRGRAWYKRLIRTIKLQWNLRSYRSNCTVRVVEDVNSGEFVETVPQGAIGIISGFNQIFRRDLIARFSDIVNFHPSILPWYRGAIPSYWAIRNGERQSGYTLHAVTPKVDAGKILFQEYVDIAEEDDERSLDTKISLIASHAMNAYLDAKFADVKFLEKTLPSPYLNPIDYVPSTRTHS